MKRFLQFMKKNILVFLIALILFFNFNSSVFDGSSYDATCYSVDERSNSGNIVYP